MPLSRPVFNSSENSADDSAVLQQLLVLVKTVDETLKGIKADCQALRTQVEQNTQKVMASIHKEDAVKPTTQTAATNIVKSMNVKGCMTSECAKLHSQKANQLVQEYMSNKDWYTLRKDLGDVMDNSSVAYTQLHSVDSVYWVGCYNQTQLASLLLCAGLHVNTTDDNGDTMLHGAAQGRALQIMKLLLHHGAGVDIRGWNGDTPLMRAARGSDHLKIVELLVQVGADTAARDKEGRTALDLAKLHGRTEVMNYLGQLPH